MNVKADKNSKDRSDPAYVGPGTWDVIHRLARAATTKVKQERFMREMKTICYGFPCHNCKKHCSAYIADHPMEEYLDRKVEVNGREENIGMFMWSWKFHNAVNARLNKPIMPWQTAYDMYDVNNNSTCSEACHASGNDSKVTDTFDSSKVMRVRSVNNM